MSQNGLCESTFSLEFPSELPDELERCHDPYHDSGQSGSDGDEPDRFTFELVKAVTKRPQLTFEAIMPVFAPDNYLLGEKAAVHGGKFVAHVFAAEFAMMSQFVNLVGCLAHEINHARAAVAA